jgi:hypothetical protein
MKYATLDDVDKYISLSANTALQLQCADRAALVSMINYFAQGAITVLSNRIYEAIHESDHDGVYLTHGTAKGCRCGMCYEWQLVDENGVVVDAAESLDDWVDT